MQNRVLTSHILNTLRILKAKNPGDTYYEEYLKHFGREGWEFYDQYHLAIETVLLREPKKILEIGVRTGLSICNMLSAYVNVNVIEKIVLIDIWTDGFASPEIVKMNMRAMNFGEDFINNKVQFIKGDSIEEVPKLKEKFDYILVDGDHSKTGAFSDLCNVVDLVSDNGVIVFDDISPYGCSLQDVWDKFKEAYPDRFSYKQDVRGKGVAWAIPSK